MSAKKLMLIALAAAGALATSMVQARDVDVQWSVTIGGGLPLPRPVYLPVPPVYVPAPPVVVPVPQRVYVPVIERPYPVYGYPVPRRTHWDADGDGIPNRYDRVYNPRWDRDGDGIPNRYDRHDDRRDRWHHGGHQGSKGRGHARGHEGGNDHGYSGGHDGWRHERQIRSVSR